MLSPESLTRNGKRQDFLKKQGTVLYNSFNVYEQTLDT